MVARMFITAWLKRCRMSALSVVVVLGPSNNDYENNACVRACMCATQGGHERRNNKCRTRSDSPRTQRD